MHAVRKREVLDGKQKTGHRSLVFFSLRQIVELFG